MYEVFYSDEALKVLKKMDKSDSQRIVEKVSSAKEAPERFAKRLTGSSLWSLRVGNYRVILEIDAHEKKLLVVTLGHRKNIYEKIE